MMTPSTLTKLVESETQTFRIGLDCGGYWPEDGGESFRDGVRDFYDMLDGWAESVESGYNGEGCGVVIIRPTQPMTIEQVEAKLLLVRPEDLNVVVEDVFTYEDGGEEHVGVTLSYNGTDDDNEGEDE